MANFLSDVAGSGPSMPSVCYMFRDPQNILLLASFEMIREKYDNDALVTV